MFYINQALRTLPEEQLCCRVCTRFYTTLGKQKPSDLTSHSREFPRDHLSPQNHPWYRRCPGSRHRRFTAPHISSGAAKPHTTTSLHLPPLPPRSAQRPASSFPSILPPDTFPLSIFITLGGVNSEADELSSSPSSPPPPPSPPASSPSQALPAAGRLAPSCGPAAGARAGERGGEREGPGGRGRGLAPTCRPWGHRQQAVCLFVLVFIL